MNDGPISKPSKDRLSLAGQVGAKATRKRKAQRNPKQGLWSGLGMLGLIGWSVVVPTLLGAALGIWLDKHHRGQYSWTLVFMVAGLTIGCLNAWRWVAKEDQDMREEREENDE